MIFEVLKDKVENKKPLSYYEVEDILQGKVHTENDENNFNREDFDIVAIILRTDFNDLEATDIKAHNDSCIEFYDYVVIIKISKMYYGIPCRSSKLLSDICYDINCLSWDDKIILKKYKMISKIIQCYDWVIDENSKNK